MLLKNTKRGGGSRIYTEASMGFYIYFGISDLLVHQRGALLKSARWMVLYLHGFMES